MVYMVSARIGLATPKQPSLMAFEWLVDFVLSSLWDLRGLNSTDGTERTNYLQHLIMAIFAGRTGRFSGRVYAKKRVKKDTS